jgi:hypothetical protein
MRDMKPLPDRDPARAKLAAAIAVETGAARGLQVAEQALEHAERGCWQAQSALDELRRAPIEPSSSFANQLAALIASGKACNDVNIFERPRDDAHARIAKAEKEIMVWQEAISECEVAVRDKRADVATAKARVERAAREIIADPDVVARLLEAVEEMTAEVINRRVALRYILFNGLKGELSASDREKIEELFRTDRLPAGFRSVYNAGWEMHAVHRTWEAAFQKLMEDSTVGLP